MEDNSIINKKTNMDKNLNNNDNSYSFYLGICGFVSLIMIPVVSIILGVIGCYYGYAEKKKLYFIMNFFVAITGLVFIYVALLNVAN